ncbi:MAG: thiamine diphosphokinase [Ilumatobacteraceae bacterium]
MNDTVVIVTGAAPLDPLAVAAIPGDAIVIAADGGLDHARAAGLTPAGLIGDLDSVSEIGLAWAEQHATIQRHPVDKDATDTELAVALAAGMDPATVVLIAGGGDRLDHTLAAIGALGAPVLTSVPRVECWWGDQYLQVVHGPARVVIQTQAGARISLLAMHGPCAGITLSGARWPLERADLASMVGYGLSNIATGTAIELTLSTGILTVFVDPPPTVRSEP